MTLGNLQGLEETAGNIVLGYQAKLSYDSAMFKSVKVEGMNGWTATYENGTIVADTTSAKPNTDITKITLTLNQNLTAGISGKININNVLLSDGENDFTFNKEAGLANTIIFLVVIILVIGTVSLIRYKKIKLK